METSRETRICHSCILFITPIKSYRYVDFIASENADLFASLVSYPQGPPEHGSTEHGTPEHGPSEHSP